MKNLEQLLQSPGPHEFHFFWRGSSPLSQWYASPFLLGGVVYPTAEHYMMAEKARMFNDQETLQKILVSRTPSEAKDLGRQVRPFDPEYWDTLSFGTVIRGNLAKFSQNHFLRQYLLSTADKILAEASPYDRIWGIGLAPDDPNAQDPRLWRGQNRLGFALMCVRRMLPTEFPVQELEQIVDV